MGLRLPGSPREPGICHLNRIPIRECGEELVDLLTGCSGMLIKAKLSLLRKTAAQMLQKAQDSLPDSYALQVSTALRTYETQSKGYFGYLEKLREQHPEWGQAVLRREANKFWHPPDQKAPPGHCTGGAVDVNLVGPDGVEKEMRAALKEGINTNPTYVRWLTPETRANREILIAAMTGAGFSNCYDEWWHWSYGDSGWACRTGRAWAIYGAVLDAASVGEQ